MPTRAEVIASKIQQYDAQITGEQNADIDDAIAKLATAQLASGTIGGGGGGGGGTGDASAANQIAGNNSLSSIDGKLPALGQATPAASTPVVLPAAQITALTPPTNTGYALDTSVNSLLKPASTLASVTTVGSVTAITNALPAGTNSIGQVTANAGTDLNTSLLALESGGNLASINTKTPTQGQALEAASSPVVLPATQITALTPPSNAGYSTATLQTTGNTSLGLIEAKIPSLGQALVTTSTPVVLPLTQITALTPPTNTGYSTSALQTTGNTSLGTINTAVTAVNTKLPAALGQALVTTSLAVALPLTQIATLAAPIVQLASPPAAFTLDIASSTITASTISTAFVPNTGTAQIFQVGITAVTGTLTTYDLTVQESSGGGIWYDIYTFPTITSTVSPNYFSPPIALAGRNFRYVETITGTTPSVSRAIQRGPSNLQVQFNPIPTRLGGASIIASEFFVGARMIKKLSIRNGGASSLFVQFHNTVSSPTTGAIPVCGEIYLVSVSAGLLLDSTTFGGLGQNYGANTRVTLSTTQQTYTPVTVFTGISLSIEVNA